MPFLKTNGPLQGMIVTIKGLNDRQLWKKLKRRHRTCPDCGAGIRQDGPMAACLDADCGWRLMLRTWGRAVGLKVQ